MRFRISFTSSYSRDEGWVIVSVTGMVHERLEEVRGYLMHSYSQLDIVTDRYTTPAWPHVEVLDSRFEDGDPLITVIEGAGWARETLRSKEVLFFTPNGELRFDM